MLQDKKNTKVEESFIKSDLRRTMLKVHILLKAREERINPYSLVKEFLGDKPFSSFFKGAVELRDDTYNCIRSLEKAGLLKSSRKIEKGRLKLYYSTTSTGNKVLKTSMEEFHKGVFQISRLFKQ